VGRWLDLSDAQVDVGHFNGHPAVLRCFQLADFDLKDQLA